MVDHWDKRFLDLAAHVAGWSKDPSTKVGAVIAHPRNKRVISVGFNGFPSGVEDRADRLEDRDTKYQMVVHAETNALLFAGPAAEGATLYVHPIPPCPRCAVLIIQAGIRRVVFDHEGFTDPRWGDQARLSVEMFQEAGVTVDHRGSDPS
ncbi:MAG: dCMP deaminase family protein [Rhodobacterales bacterium]|nr:dCMP deaminase family protein [Rhodobacterales bacterium]